MSINMKIRKRQMLRKKRKVNKKNNFKVAIAIFFAALIILASLPKKVFAEGKKKFNTNTSVRY